MNAKEKIIAAAKEIFADYHYEYATVKMICDKAKVNIALVNYHFGSKKALYLEVIASIHNCIEHPLEKIFHFEIKQKSKKDLEAFISQTVQALVSVTNDADAKKWHKIVFRELHNPSVVFDDIYKLYLLPALERIDLNFAKFFPQMDKQKRFMWIITLVSQACFIHSSQGLVFKYCGADFYKPSNIDEYSTHICKTISNSLGNTVSKDETGKSKNAKK